MKPQTMAYIPTQKTQDALLEFYRQSYGLLNRQWNLREQLLSADRAYMRELDLTEEHHKAKLAAKKGDPTKFQNIIMPVVMPQVEAAVTYQQSVFLTGYPIFGTVSYPEYANEAVMMDSLMGDHQVKGRWVQELLKTIRKGFKYNLGALEADWKRRTTFSFDFAGIDGPTRGKEVVWEGNVMKDIDLYNAFWDTRCAVEDLPEYGEFFGYNELKSRIALKQFIQDLPTKINVREALESGFTAPTVAGEAGVQNYYIPQLNPEALIDLTSLHATTDWLAWAGLANNSQKIDYKNLYQLTTLYARILPSDFNMTGVPGPNTPQVWKLHIVNNQVMIYCERMTNIHNLIPVFMYRPYDDGLGYQTKSLSKNVEPMQEITSALANSSIAARRRAISDRMLYDPSRVSKSAINSESPNAKIPVRPSAYSSNLSEAIYPIPFRDDQFQINGAEINQYLGLANIISGQNPAKQGQFVKGNKTRTEFSEIMGYANGRDEAIAISTEASFFTPLKEVLKINILQYQKAGQVYNPEMQTSVEVNPMELRKAALTFKISDGKLPSEKLIDGESLSLAFQTMAQIPQLAGAYNLAPLFSYLMKSRGANLQPFEKSVEQQSYEQALQTWQQGAMQIAGAIQEAAKAGEPLSQEDIKELLAANPMPTPEQFGYDPAKPNLSNTNPMNPEVPSILDSLKQTTSNALQNSQGMQGRGQQ